MIKEIKRKIKKIDPNKLYSPQEILDLGVITDTSLKASLFTFYRVLKSGNLPYINIGIGKRPRYRVNGKDLIKYLESRF